MQLSINDLLCSLKEDVLTRQFIMPLIEILHPGRIEYTHSPIEAGRDIVSFGKDCLGRDHILCIQVKATPISHGAAFATLQGTLKLAKTMGVVLETGGKCFPQEVWLVSSHPFSEQKRRQVADALQEMERQNSKFIFGEELTRLLIHHLPDEIARLQKVDNSKTIQLISELYIHTESRAFGLPQDRSLDQFYVSATLSIDSEFAYRALANGVSMNDQIEPLGTTINQILHKLSIPKSANRASDSQSCLLSQEEVKKYLLDQSPHYIFFQEHDIPHEMRGDYPEDRWQETISENKFVSFDLTIRFSKRFKSLVKTAQSRMGSCPHELNGNAKDVKNAWSSLRRLNDILLYANKYFPDSIQLLSGSTAKPIRLRLTRLRDVCKLEHTVLVEGPPGCGKTTLLRMLAIDLLSCGEKVMYLPCYRIGPNLKYRAFPELLKKCALGATSLEWLPRETHILIDGLDEAPFDLSNVIHTHASEYKSVVVSGRSAYVRKMQFHFLSLSIEVFTAEERDEFFQKWFDQRQDLLETTNDLVRTYPDIGEHTRLPLIATMLVALVESGYTPRTRAEIYDHRLELLLSRWDRSRGVTRTFVDNPDAKRRFLRYLAFSMHSSTARRRMIRRSELQTAFESALGMWGYSIKMEDVVEDLVLAHGLLIEESSLVYSFGHLTFQEHLAGEYIAKEFRAKDILKLLGNDWWREPLNFYASITGNIDDLVKLASEDRGYYGLVRQLLEMASYARYTSPGAIEILKETATEVEHSASHEYNKSDF